MKLSGLLFALTTACAISEDDHFVNFIRQSQQGTGVVWDMPITATGAAAAAPTRVAKGALFQHWSIRENPAQDCLLDQKLIGAYLPAAEIKVLTLDPNGKIPRSRMDQPFTIEVNVEGLLTGNGLPKESTHVLIEQHIAGYQAGENSLDPTSVRSTTPVHRGYITANGRTVLKFPASSIRATDPTKAFGEEHFVIHTLTNGILSQTQIASGKVQVWPVASGQIKGLSQGDVIRSNIPPIELQLTDLYPGSESRFMIYEGTSVHGITGTPVMIHTNTCEIADTTSLRIADLDSNLTKDGTYTVALVSTTIYGTEFLCAPVTFQVRRTPAVAAMQVGLSVSK